MPTQIRQSDIDKLGINFPNAVANLIAAKNNHRFEVGTPRPVAVPLIESAVVSIRGKLISENPPIHEGPDTFVADYEIIDDVTEPPKSLDEKKQALRGKLLMEEHNLINKILPQGKRRFLDLKSNDIEAKLSNQMAQRTFTAEEDPDAHLQALRDNLSQEDKDHIETMKIKQEQVSKIHRFSAITEAEIEDLTEAEIDVWVQPPWPE